MKISIWKFWGFNFVLGLLAVGIGLSLINFGQIETESTIILILLLAFLTYRMINRKRYTEHNYNQEKTILKAYVTIINTIILIALMFFIYLSILPNILLVLEKTG